MSTLAASRRGSRRETASAVPLPSAPDLVESEPGRVWVARELAPELARAGLTTLRGVMDDTRGECLRALPDRENWRLELPGPPDGRGAYLKKHHAKSLRGWWRALRGAGPGATPGRVEADHIAHLAENGIPSMRLLAFGEGLSPGGLVESFVMTEELRGFAPLDDFLKARSLASPGSRARDTRGLLAGVAQVAARFHARGFNHRDFYCCHFFVRESAAPDPARFDVRLIDLQRVQRRRWLRRRWIVKDLAQLVYSAPREFVSIKDGLFFFKRYLGVRRLGLRDKRLLRRILARMRGMERKLGAHP